MVLSPCSILSIPEQLVTDNGPQFIAEAFKTFTERNGIRHIRSAPYHPASNGLAERFVQSLKQSLKATLHDGRSLVQRLSSYLLTYRTTIHATTGVPPSQLLLGRELRTRLSLIRPDVGKSVVDKQSLQKSSHDSRSRTRQFLEGDRVFVRTHRPGPDWIRGTIVEVLGPVTFIVEVEGGQRWKRHIDQLKDWLPPVDDDPASVLIDSEAGIDDSVEPPTPLIETSSPPSDSRTGESTTDSSPSVPERRYPTRDRNPPEYYRQTVDT